MEQWQCLRDKHNVLGTITFCNTGVIYTCLILIIMSQLIQTFFYRMKMILLYISWLETQAHWLDQKLSKKCPRQLKYQAKNINLGCSLCLTVQDNISHHCTTSIRNLSTMMDWCAQRKSLEDLYQQTTNRKTLWWIMPYMSKLLTTKKSKSNLCFFYSVWIKYI